MNVNFINPILQSVVNVLVTMAQLEVKPGKPFLKKNTEAVGDLTGLIGMAGDTVKGSFAITFTEPCILAIAGLMFGVNDTECTNETVDLVGEITNMVCGGAKARLAEEGYKFAMAVPMMIKGKNHCFRHATSGPVIIIPFETKVGKFFVEVCFEEKS